MEKLKAKLLYRRLFLFVVTIAGLYFLYRVRIILIPFLFAFIIAYLVNPLVIRAEKRKVPRIWAILLVYLAVFGIAGLVLTYGVPGVIGELNSLSGTIPRLTAEARELLVHMENRYSPTWLPEGVRAVIDERVRLGERFLLESAKSATASSLRLLYYLPGLLIAPVFAFYMLKDRDRILESFTMTIPRKYRNDFLAVGRDLNDIFRGFFRCQIVLSLIVGVLTGLGMYIIGLDFAIILGLISAVTEFIPFLGPLLSAIPAVSLALLVSKKTALYTVLVVVVVQQLENAVLSPRIMGKSLGLHPLVVIFAVGSAGELIGLAGIIMAVPVAASVRVILRYIYLKLVDER